MSLAASPLVLFALAAAAALLLGAWSIRWRSRQAARFRGAGGGDVVVRRSLRRRWLKAALIAVALALLALAAARPQFGSTDVPIRQEGIAVALAVDVSLSMAAEDQAPSRLAVVREEVAGLLVRLRGDRVGLVIFAGGAFPRFPLTRDAGAARQIVETLLPGMPPLPPGTDVAEAIEAAQVILAASDAAAKVILVIGDGEALQGDAIAAATAAADAGVRVYAAGVGTTAGATIAVPDPLTRQPTLKIDAATGEPVITRANPALLRALARAGRGRFVLLDRPGALGDLAADFAALEATAFAVEREGAPVERFQIFAAVGLALLLLETVVAESASGRAQRAQRTRVTGTHARRRIRGRAARRGTALAGATAAVALLAAACAGAAYSENRAGNEHDAAGRYAEALAAYRAAAVEAPEDLRLHLNAGRALHALGRFEDAMSETARALSEAGPALSALAHYNIGNHRLAAAGLLEARNAYVAALLLDPADRDAKFNLELVNLLLESGAAPAGAEGPPPAEGGGPGEAGGGQAAGGQSGAGGASPAGGGGAISPRLPSPTATPIPPALGAANAEVRDAFAAIDRTAPTVEQALQALEALRARHALARAAGGPALQAVTGDRDW